MCVCPQTQYIIMHITIAPSSICLSCNCPVSKRILNKNSVGFLLPICATCSAHFALLYLTTPTVLGEEYRSSLFFMSLSPLLY
jgi:hypothetical protein